MLCSVMQEKSTDTPAPELSSTGRIFADSRIEAILIES
jgi:hypothetical protein